MATILTKPMNRRMMKILRKRNRNENDGVEDEENVKMEIV